MKEQQHYVLEIKLPNFLIGVLVGVIVTLIVT